MSRQSNPTLIGAFVVGAVALLAAAVAIFGGSELLARKTVLVTYFDGSAKGLREGSNVAFKGVRVGFVRNIALVTDIEELSPKIEVTMELVPDSIRVVRDGTPIDGRLQGVVSIEELVDAGLSAQLGSESFVTGQLLVELDFRPDQPLELYGADAPYPEIPSVPSEIQQAIARFQTLVADIEQNVDFAGLSERVFSVLQGLDELVNSEALRRTVAGVDALVNDRATQALPEQLQGTIAELSSTIGEARALLARIDSDMDSIAGELEPAARQLRAALDEAAVTLEALRRQVSGDSAQMYQLQATLDELEAAARSMREFFDYLERHPEALVRGKQP
jgi:paraquat-inducible protein B